MPKLTKEEIATIIERKEIVAYFYELSEERSKSGHFEYALKEIEPDEITICSNVGEVIIPSNVFCAYVDIINNKLLWYGDEDGEADYVEDLDEMWNHFN